MPKGPASGRVEAKRRAWMAIEHGASMKSAMVRRLEHDEELSAWHFFNTGHGTE